MYMEYLLLHGLKLDSQGLKLTWLTALLQHRELRRRSPSTALLETGTPGIA